ncbi:MAG: radical SAM protein [Candidatus Sumerlaeia bacterium]|nr:radical SAM protein [Candidatus Sumerlaeia bacterium]
MKILFIYPEFHKEIVDTNLLEIGVSSSLLKQNNHSVDFIYLKCFPPQNAFYERIAETKPEMVVVYVDYDQFTFARKISEEIKNIFPGVMLSCVGPLCALLPESLMGISGIDFIIIGEFEMPLLETVETYQRDKTLGKIRNLWLKQQNEIIRTPLRPPINKLDALPYADRSLYPHKELVEYRGGAVSINATRGCPYQCGFCWLTPIHTAYRNKGTFYRWRSPMHIIGELMHLAKNLTINRVVFCDEQFPLEMEWLKEFRDKYKTHCGAPFQITSSAERLESPGVLDTLIEAGCDTIVLGIETGNETFRRRIAERNLKNEQILRLASKLHRANIKLKTTNMVGLPLETAELVKETFDLNAQLKPEEIKVKVFYPAPATILYHYCKQQKYIKTDSLPVRKYESVLALPFMSAESIKTAYEKLCLLDGVLRARRTGKRLEGYFNFITGFEECKIDAESTSDVTIVEETIEGNPRPAIQQTPNTKINCECELKLGSILQVYIKPKVLPVGDFIHYPKLNFTIEIQQGEKRELVFQRLLADPLKSVKNWSKQYLPLFELKPGKAVLTFSISAENTSLPDTIWGLWGAPLLTNKLKETESGIEIIPEAEFRSLQRLQHTLAEKEQQISGLIATIKSLEDEKQKLLAELDSQKKRSAELQIKILQQEKTIEEYKNIIAELEKTRAEYEQSLSGKIKKFIKKK